MQKSLIVLCGPTGIGKSKIAVEICKSLNCEIISADSRQLFKEMTIGTAIPSVSDLKAIPHHFIHSHSIHNYYNASLFEQEVLDFLNEYYHDKYTCLMVGGSGLYINAVCEGIDELPTIETGVRNKWQNIYIENGIKYLQEHLKNIDSSYYAKVDKANPKRLLKAIEIFEMTGKPYSSFLEKEKKPRQFDILKIGLNTERDKLYRMVNQRVDEMMENGLLDEAMSLHAFKELTPLKTVGYRELFEYFEGRTSLEEAVEQIKNHSRAYARRQLTWFRRDKDITWFKPDEPGYIISFIMKFLNQKV